MQPCANARGHLLRNDGCQYCHRLVLCPVTGASALECSAQSQRKGFGWFHSRPGSIVRHLSCVAKSHSLILIINRASLSACIRLVYTVNLTNADEYLYGISDVVLWGYAENGVGMIVGCLATLRPLFRRIFKLGGETTPHNTPGTSYAKRQSKLRPRGGDVEWVALDDSKVGSIIHGRTLPNSSSEEHILGNGIKVTREVEQDVEVTRKR